MKGAPRPNSGGQARRSPLASLPRRRFLGALAASAAGGLVPLLESPAARAQTVLAPPKRVVLLFNPNGTVPDAFWPAGAESETAFELGPVLGPLAPFRDRLLLLRGLDLSVVVDDPRGGPHQRGMGALYTGWGLQEGTMRGGDGRLAGWANGLSVDQQIVRELDPPTLLPSLELGARATAAEVRSRIIYSNPAAPVPPINDPREVFQRLVTGFSGALDGPENEEARAQRRLVLGAVQRQYQSLSPRISGEDREKFERHVDFLSGMVRRLDFGIRQGGACVEPIEPSQRAVDEADAMPDIVREQLDLLVLALACDITRVASVQFSTAINAIRFPWLAGKYAEAEGHAISHKGPSDTDARDELIARGRWYSEQVAYLLERLAAIPEGEGSLLDNTLVVWGSELSVGNIHSLKEIPFVLAGNVGGHFRTGRYLQFEGLPHNRLLISTLQAMGVSATTFGDPSFGSDGPLPGLTA